MGANGTIISKEDIEFITNKLNHLATEKLEKFQRNLKAVSYLTYLFHKANLKPIIVGGHAVELYTVGHYTTMGKILPAFMHTRRQFRKHCA